MKNSSLCLILSLFLIPLPCTGSARRHPITRPPYLTWQSDPSTTMTVNWGTAEPVRGVVEYGRTRRYGRRVREKEKTTVHHVELTGLEPGTRCYYRIQGDFESSFRTAPAGEEDFSFCLVGHTGGSQPENRYPPRLLIARLRQMEPLFLINAGDVVYFSRTVENFDDDFFSLFSPLSHMLPIMISPSNHDIGYPYNSPDGVDYGAFRELFPYPDGGPGEGNGLWYTFCVSGIRFIGLAYGSPLGEGSEQRGWLEGVLERNTADFTVVFLGGNQRIFDFDIDELFRFLSARGVSLVLGGDGVHVWQKTMEGIPYVFCGSTGASPPPFIYLQYRKDYIFLYAMDARGQVLFTRKVEKKTSRRPLFFLSDFSGVKTSRGLTFTGPNRFRAPKGDSYFIIDGLDVDLREGNCVECVLSSAKGGYFSVYWDPAEEGTILRRGKPISWIQEPGTHAYRYYLPREDPLGEDGTALKRLKIGFFELPGGEGEISSISVLSNRFHPACGD